MNKPITRIVKLTLHGDCVNDFVAAYTEAQKTIKTFNGCMSLKLYNDVQQACVFFTYSTWQSEQLLNDYRQSEFFAEVWSKVKPMFAERAQAWSLVEC